MVRIFLFRQVTLALMFRVVPRHHTAPGREVTDWYLPAVMIKLITILPRRVRKLKRQIKASLRDFKAELASIAHIRSGNKLSRLIRVIFEKSNIKAILGGNIALLVLANGLITPTSDTLAQIEPETRLLPEVQVKLTTEIKIRYPVGAIKLNQGFSLFHRGLDLDGVVGDPVYPIMNGVVETREFSKYGYGNALIVDHQNGFKSRYAHLSKIEVKDGDKVLPNVSLGRLGSTGRSTGPHLHLEVYLNGKTVNPLTVLGPTPIQPGTSVGGK